MPFSRGSSTSRDWTCVSLQLLHWQAGSLPPAPHRKLHIKSFEIMWNHLGMGFPDSSVSKESACNVGNLGLIPGLGRSSGEGKGYPLQYSGLENSMGLQKWLSDFHFIREDWVLGESSERGKVKQRRLGWEGRKESRGLWGPKNKVPVC